MPHKKGLTAAQFDELTRRGSFKLLDNIIPLLRNFSFKSSSTADERDMNKVLNTDLGHIRPTVRGLRYWCTRELHVPN
jgi:hypothetical protein